MDELAGFIDSVKADVLIGMDSRLRRDISDFEVFPREFVAYRKDRPSHERDVFLLERSSLKSVALDIQCDVECVLCTITLQYNFSFALGAIYRPPNLYYNTLQPFHDITSQVSSQTFILAGDFIMPDLKWCDGICIRGTGCRVIVDIKDIVDSYGLTQFATWPTTNNNVLDLVF